MPKEIRLKSEIVGFKLPIDVSTMSIWIKYLTEAVKCILIATTLYVKKLKTIIQQFKARD